MAALRKAAAEQEQLEAQQGSSTVAAPRNLIADASSFSNMLNSFDFGSK
jgi:hypothetical protein